MTRRPASILRPAFTLVELLMVIMIIGILISLLLPAVFKIRQAGRRAQTGSDINQLSTAAASFKQEFKFYPPDSFTIPDRVDSNNNNFLILKSMYPRWPLIQVSPGVTQPAPEGTMLSATTTGALTNQGATLVGIQSLFYFVTGPSNTGWRGDAPVEPTATAQSQKGPFFEYGGPALNLYRYTDPHGTPYAYFASRLGGKYNAPTQNLTNADGVASGVNPYLSGGKFVNSDSVQIISAGTNKLFGIGGNNWTPGVGDYEELGKGGDDMANFYGGKQLGSE